MRLYSASDFERLSKEKNTSEHRSDFRRDYGRLLHSSAFRRLQGKTQLFPGDDSDFFRNRLTHSLEVAQIAHCIAKKLNREFPFFDETGAGPIDTDLVEFAALAHDLGHPPFGHNGEHALNNLMAQSGGFEGNAQTLRIVTCLSRKKIVADQDGVENSIGLDVTKRAICAILKYDKEIPLSVPLAATQKPATLPRRRQGEKEYEVVKGYYSFEAEIVAKAKQAVLNGYCLDGGKKFRTLECSIMDVSDDIAYSTYDLEDAFKAGFLSPLDLLGAGEDVYTELYEKVNKALDKEVYPRRSKSEIRKTLRTLVELIPHAKIQSSDDAITIAKNARLMKASVSVNLARTDFTSKLIARFADAVELIQDTACPALSIARLPERERLEVEILKNLTYILTIRSHRLRIVETRGQEIVRTIFTSIQETPALMPDDFWQLHKDAEGDSQAQDRIVCDFVAGMTDRYAVEFYARLKSEEHRTIFKPM